MGWQVPAITLAVKCPASWNAGVGVRCYQGPKEELEEVVLEGLQ